MRVGKPQHAKQEVMLSRGHMLRIAKISSYLEIWIYLLRR